ncbi:sulfurtransferase [Piscinibacter koreensis]|uniref:Sulfurtransferase n=1 Tax=Piscinibacter koreensis TaxID=2742824 RepID=A0A7Y6NR97_9BURK|nr:rhodanese-like domain-containing protein [Schlegelella koreensis]NUZ07876.1 sulfurtransferase [Schlegelella koreensis]
MTHYALADEGWLARHHDANDLILIDARPAADYWAGHLEQARHLDPTLLVLQRTDAASIERFQNLLAWLLSTLGIERSSRVLVYGRSNEVNVSRVAWALGYAGVEHVVLLDGGLSMLGEPSLVRDAPAVGARRFALEPVTRFLASAHDVLSVATGERTRSVIVDARQAEEFVGRQSNARRRGRIPGAVHWDASREVDARGLFRQAPALADDVARIAGSDDRVVAYCGGGGRAARTFVALQLAGHSRVAVYPASWNEWGNDDAFPVETVAPEVVAA